MRKPGRWTITAAAGAAVIGAAIGLAVTAHLPGTGGSGRALPPDRARVYENVDACLLTGPTGLADPTTAQVWAGMQDASTATTARVSYLAVPGPQTAAAAAPYAGSLLARHCNPILADAPPERAALLADAPRYPQTSFILSGPGTGPANVTILTATPSGLRAAVATTVESHIHAAGG